MALSGNLTEFYELNVRDFEPGDTLTNTAQTAWRIRCEYDGEHSMDQLLLALTETDDVTAVRALIFGAWMEGGESFEVSPQPAVELLVSLKHKFPNLEALFIGDITSEENEMSWIQQADLSALWSAFPKLVSFASRGSNGLSLGRIRHDRLESLCVQSGGLGAGQVREILNTQAPLTHLEIWTGSSEYGATSTLEDLRPLLSGSLFPKLQSLALCNCEFADDLVEALVASPLMARLKALDLSKGIFTDRGARVLIDSGRLADLDKLDITDTYVSAALSEELARHVADLTADELRTPDRWDDQDQYYVAVGE